MDIKAFKQKFDPVLARILKKKIASAAQITGDAFVLELIRYTEALLMSGGKRVRPYMAYLAYKAAGGKADAKALEVFAGLELFHAFALVHDDIMDRGTERHGIPTVHRHAASRMKELGRHGETEHLAEAQAILLGDILFNWAAECLAGTKAYPVFAQMIDEVITGQMLDVDSMARRSVEARMIEERMRLKTATYTFVRPMQVGVMLAGKNAKLMKFAEAYGVPLGVGFQIQDDYLDLAVPSDMHGKTAFSDLRDGQHTVFTQYIIEHGTPEQVRELRSLFGAHLTEKDRPLVVKLFEMSGSFEYGRSRMESYFEEAEKAAGKMKAFTDLVSYIRNRSH